jgi:nitroreductase
MNDKLAILFARRSVRRYADREVSEDMVRDILDAAMAAPSAVAKDPWRMIVVRDGSMLARIAEGLPNGRMLASAGVGLVVCGDLDAAHDNQLSYMLQDCSAAIENALIAAAALGLGACWLGVHPREDRVAHLRDVLGIPDGVIPVCAIAIGWPDGPLPPARTRFDASKVHLNRW